MDIRDNRIELGNRLREVRKALGFKSQVAFAEQTGTTRSAYSKYEVGDVVPTDSFIQLICSKFDVSETWLRTGKGEKFQKSEDSVIAQLADRYSLDTKGKAVIKAFLSLTREQQDVFVTAVCAAAEEVKRAQEADRKDAEKKKAALEESDQLLNTTFDCKEDDGNYGMGGF